MESFFQASAVGRILGQFADRQEDRLQGWQSQKHVVDREHDVLPQLSDQADESHAIQASQWVVCAENQFFILWDVFGAPQAGMAFEIFEYGRGEVDPALVFFLVKESIDFFFVQEFPNERENESGKFPVKFRGFFPDDLLDIDGSFGQGERQHAFVKF